MASRKEQKDAARQRRLEEERAAALQVRRTRRLQMVGGAVAAAIVIVVVLVIVSSGGSSSKGKAIDTTSPAAKTAAASVTTLLKGIPQHGNVLGNPNARVTMTEYGDLVCPICRDFALGAEQQIIAKDVRAGKVKIQYKALETASGSNNGAMFVPGQMAALAAGAQDRGWNYIELFYHLQQDELTHYVTTPFLQKLAQLVPGLDYAKWNSARGEGTFKAQVLADEQAAASAGYQSTPTVIFQGPVSQSKALVGDYGYSAYESAIKSVY